MNTSILTLVLFIGGLVALIGGATIFVDGASGLARRLKVPPMVIGLTVVALGTSAPEIGVNVMAALYGQPALAIGNVVGSNILNILAVLGLSALIGPLQVSSQVVRLDVPVMVVSALLFGLFALDGNIANWEAVSLLLFLLIYTVVQIRGAKRARQEALPRASSRRHSSQVNIVAETPERPIWLQIGFVVGGAVLLVFGSNWLVTSATTVAKALEVDDRIIGLTVVAIGTSLPEMAASLAAAFKGERELAVGNVVGSNIYNVLAVVGCTGIIAQGGITVPPTALQLDFPVMLAASIVCFPIFWTGFRIARWEGGVFVSYYLLYLTYLILDTTSPTLAHTLGQFTPIILLATTVVALFQWLRERSRRDSSLRP